MFQFFFFIASNYNNCLFVIITDGPISILSNFYFIYHPWGTILFSISFHHHRLLLPNIMLSSMFFSICFLLSILIVSNSIFLIYQLKCFQKIIHFFLVSSHVGILGCKIADHLATSIKSFFFLHFLKIPFLLFSPPRRILTRYHILSLGSSWRCFSQNFTFWHRVISPFYFHTSLVQKIFHHLDFYKSSINVFCYHRFGHNLLPFCLFRFTFNNSSPFCWKKLILLSFLL